MPAKLESRIPEIIAELQPRVLEAIHHGADNIAQKAAAKAVSQGLEQTHEMVQGLQSPEAVRAEGPMSVGVYAAWYAHFAEFGTVHEPARPFLVPAVEEGMAGVVADVETSLRKL